jgi:hypothetical protein
VIYRLSIVSLSPSHSLTRAPESLHKSLILFVFSGSISTIPRHMQLALVAFSCVLAVFPRLQLRDVAMRRPDCAPTPCGLTLIPAKGFARAATPASSSGSGND